MDNQPQTPPAPAPQEPVNNQPAPQPPTPSPQPPEQPASTPVPPASPAGPAPTASPAAPVAQKQVSTPKRAGVGVVGALLVIFAISVVQGQVSHGFDVIGLILIILFGGIGLVLLYAGITKKLL